MSNPLDGMRLGGIEEHGEEEAPRRRSAGKRSLPISLNGNTLKIGLLIVLVLVLALSVLVFMGKISLPSIQSAGPAAVSPAPQVVPTTVPQVKPQAVEVGPSGGVGKFVTALTSRRVPLKEIRNQLVMVIMALLFLLGILEPLLRDDKADVTVVVLPLVILTSCFWAFLRQSTPAAVIAFVCLFWALAMSLSSGSSKSADFSPLINYLILSCGLAFLVAAVIKKPWLYDTLFGTAPATTWYSMKSAFQLFAKGVQAETGLMVLGYLSAVIGLIAALRGEKDKVSIFFQSLAIAALFLPFILALKKAIAVGPQAWNSVFGYLLGIAAVFLWIAEIARAKRTAFSLTAVALSLTMAIVVYLRSNWAPIACFFVGLAMAAISALVVLAITFIARKQDLSKLFDSIFRQGVLAQPADILSGFAVGLLLVLISI